MGFSHTMVLIFFAQARALRFLRVLPKGSPNFSNGSRKAKSPGHPFAGSRGVSCRGNFSYMRAFSFKKTYILGVTNASHNC